ncbi:MAG: response regulator transcription factor [Verrucomicrobiota bacterium]|jgi:two-component system, NarL family, nitrate/nitrite response regulator NarL
MKLNKPTPPPDRESVGKLRLLLVDDHPLVREGIRASLESRPDFEIVAQAGNGREAVERARVLQPDLVLMDISMPGLNGLEATKLLLKECPGVAVLILTVHDNQEYILEVMKSGARGYVLKDSSPEELIHAIDRIRTGQEFFSPKVSEVLASEFIKLARTTEPVLPEPLLSDREKKVIALIAQGLSSKDVANQLDISVRTVETYRERLMRKLELNNIADMTRYAIAHHLIELK